MPKTMTRKAAAVSGGFNPKMLDDGIRGMVVLLRDGGFKTFTSCQGGKGHAFQHETIGLELEGRYPDFEKWLVKFLHAQGMRNFSISLMTDFHPDYPEGKRCVYLSGLDILSLDRRRRVIEAAKRKARQAVRELREMGL